MAYSKDHKNMAVKYPLPLTYLYSIWLKCVIFQVCFQIMLTCIQQISIGSVTFGLPHEPFCLDLNVHVPDLMALFLFLFCYCNF